MAKLGRPRKVSGDEGLGRRAELAQAEPTEQQAYELAKLLKAGVPQADAVCYVLGSTEAGLIELALGRWMQSRLVVDALAALNGGKWPEIEPDVRLDIALDKHYAEMAHFLYTHDFESAEGKELGKLNTAREALQGQRSGRLQANSPFMQFLSKLLKPAGALPEAVAGQGRGEATRGATLGLVAVEPVVDAVVTETSEEEHA